MRILLIAGGWSPEREVSLNGAAQIESACHKLGHEVELFDLYDFDSLTERARKADFCFINLHGSPGEDGLVQALLDSAGVPYQGAGASASFRALHKAASKQLFAAAGLATPPWEYHPVRPPTNWQCSLTFPIFVKPNLGGSSLLMGLAHDHKELTARMDEIFDSTHAGEGVLLEQAVNGMELTCGMLGNMPLPTVLIEPPADSTFFDYHAKYDADGARELCPAPIDESLELAVRDATLRACEALGVTGYGRADFMVDEAGTPWLLEVNTLPGMTTRSLLPQEAAQAGLTFTRLIERLIELGLQERATP